MGNIKFKGQKDTDAIFTVGYTGYEQTPEVNIYTKDAIRITSKNYTISYENNIDAGSATVIITGTGILYSGEIRTTFEIVPRDIATVPISVTSEVPYNAGLPVTPLFFLQAGQKGLQYGSDYSVSYENNTNAGIATGTIIGKGNYTGVKKFTYVIKPAHISTWYSDSEYLIPDQKYTGNEIKPVKARGSAYPTSGYFKNGVFYYSGTTGTSLLKEGVDYTVSYKNNIEPGTATATITGIGNCTGTITKTFNIFKPAASSTQTQNANPSSGNTNVIAAPASSTTTHTESSSTQPVKNQSTESQKMMRLYNPNSGEHFYTASTAERDSLVKAGWKYEGDNAWTAPVKSSTPV